MDRINVKKKGRKGVKVGGNVNDLVKLDMETRNKSLK